MADLSYWDRLKQFVLPDPETQARAIQSVQLPESRPEPGPWQRIASTPSGLARNFTDAMRAGVEQLAGGAGETQANSAVAPTKKTWDPWLKDFEEGYFAKDQKLLPEMKAGLSYIQTRAPRYTSRAPTYTPQQISEGATRGEYPFTGQQKVRIAQEIKNPEYPPSSADIINRMLAGEDASDLIGMKKFVPTTAEEAAHTMGHEHAHAQQAQKLAAKRGYPDTRVPHLDFGDMYNAVGRIAGNLKMWKLNPREWPEFYDPAKVNEMTDQLINASPGMSQAFNTIEKAGYKREDFPKYYDYFKPRADNPAYGKEHTLTPKERAYWTNPYEVQAEKIGSSTGAGFKKFTEKTFPELTGRQWADYLQELEARSKKVNFRHAE